MDAPWPSWRRKASSFTKMHHTQPRGIPERIYEPNIIHNPFTWMGIWTPHGWRVHKKRWGKAERVTVSLSGDGATTFFPEALLDPESGQVEWQDDLHLKDDPFTDAGIYPTDPRVEYPAGRSRWAVSHTLLCYPVADHGLYTHEYRWDMTHGHLFTHFRHHVSLEEAHTDNRDGMTVRVKHTPISETIEGNVHYPVCNSAVRGVWSTPDKSGTNHYCRRIAQQVTMHNGVYAIAPRTPVVQCYGVYRGLPDDFQTQLFDPHTGECTDYQRLIDQLQIPFDEPKLGWNRSPRRMVESQVYEGPISIPDGDLVTVEQSQLDELRRRLGARYQQGKVGYGYEQSVDSDDTGYEGYIADFDLNNDGVIDAEDEARLAPHIGRQVRTNLYKDAYFGGDWLTGSYCLQPEHQPGVQIIADYTYGGGYDAQTGVIRLLESPGPGQRVWVEYHYDAPAQPGENNIRLHLFRETEK